MAQAPVLVVKEYAAVLHAGLLTGLETILNRQSLFLLRHHIAPPYPRRNTRHARELEYAVGHASTVVTFNYNLSTFSIDAESVGSALALYYLDCWLG